MTFIVFILDLPPQIIEDDFICINTSSNQDKLQCLNQKKIELNDYIEKEKNGTPIADNGEKLTGIPGCGIRTNCAQYQEILKQVEQKIIEVGAL